MIFTERTVQFFSLDKWLRPHPYSWPYKNYQFRFLKNLGGFWWKQVFTKSNKFLILFKICLKFPKIIKSILILSQISCKELENKHWKLPMYSQCLIIEKFGLKDKVCSWKKFKFRNLLKISKSSRIIDNHLLNKKTKNKNMIITKREAKRKRRNTKRKIKLIKMEEGAEVKLLKEKSIWPRENIKMMTKLQKWKTKPFKTLMEKKSQ